MSELDKWFPRANTTNDGYVPRATVTQWPDAPEALRPLLDRFQELTGWQFTKQERKFQIKMASDYYNTVRTSDPDLLEAAYRTLDDRGMTLKSVKSCMNQARWLNRIREDWDSEEARQEHKESWTFDE